MVKELTALQIAEQEFAREKQEENVRKFKQLLLSKDKAEKILAGIDAEIEDLKARINDGTA